MFAFALMFCSNVMLMFQHNAKLTYEILASTLIFTLRMHVYTVVSQKKGPWAVHITSC